MNNSVENRFFAIVCGALLVFVAPLFVLFLFLSSERAEKEIRDHITVLLAANAQALAKPLWDLDEDTITQVSATTVSEGEQVQVNVRDTSGQLDITQSTIPKSFDGKLESISRAITYNTVDGKKTLGTITVLYPQLGIFDGLKHEEIVFISIFIFAVLTVFGTALIGNRIFVIQPLMRLAHAIEATRQLGSRHHVDWQSNDEMGRLARSFNEMQIKLEREETELKLAHRGATDTYNLTPAMLFSLDENDCISAVSDYWLAATGYRREQVLGRPFASLLMEQSREKYIQRKQQHGRAAPQIDVTVKFPCIDGRIMDLLILESTAVKGGRSLSVMTDVTELKQSEDRNLRQAITDHLTGLLNRQGFETALDAKINEADLRHRELACLFIDLDRFKWINDNLGHAAGDAALCELVARLQAHLSPGDIAARLGGDEFAILILSEDAEEKALAMAASVAEIFAAPFVGDARLSASIGIAIYPRHAANASELLQKSDMAMYAKKREGKNGAQIFDNSMLDDARGRAEVETFIETGLTEDWFEAYLQPIVNIEDRAIAGFEALMRLHHPQKGILPPKPIIDIAEETGSIIRIGTRIMEKAIANLARISKLDGMQDVYLAINFSPLQFEPALPALIAGLLMRHEIKPQRIVIEITEAVLMDDNPEVRNIINEICSFGCRIALDDFGTGYSSLSYINRFPVDIIKIDQSFTKAINDASPDVRRKSRMLVESITTLSHKMNCTVIAEGIETEDECATLIAMGIDYGQGYLFHRPQHPDALMETLAGRMPGGRGSMAIAS
ncbi:MULTISPECIES: putative bifunctional diguanylate cyclase/phosphodiesterase [unclassified Rhizobium]|uniref:putative bifunctional diguanylate cyclase/phosphodiesterase n=1 Tax=unclassified Rhizobium TaxID=2613769 RepID=UPI001ADA879F|nr:MULTISPECIES: EAL domain-containing protein [unclassified Rhizobium]MBO9099045.1 EAL domain-containing protein [Rhizobium sp. L58/93]MBO9132148.1 EAL domain-containing protein [Rhizobium sp. B209b/85]MBO9169308.1 EAL domain-containing protein [Rhizobium sp. L245/93]MBO9185260.1 EAL domain-containing protein [Rhizobium sp. E27B/91]QXZ85403.1 EAL domain-containing protein [Rhizobium sp. K1/93]